MGKLKLKEDIIMMLVISFIGFCFENLWMLFRYSVINNRNMFLPFLLGYGIFIVTIYHVVGTPDKLFNKYELSFPLKYFIYFIICFLLVSIGEILLGSYVEWRGHFHYWNYAGIPMHITRYTSVPTSTGFALVITLFMNYAYIPLQKLISKFSKKIPIFIVIVILIILVIDLTISFRKMVINKGQNIIWVINIKR